MSLGRVARFTMTDAFLADVLNLPAGTRILDVSFPQADGGDTIRVLVQHEGLQESQDTIREASPQFTRDDKGFVHFDGWGQS